MEGGIGVTGIALAAIDPLGRAERHVELGLEVWRWGPRHYCALVERPEVRADYIQKFPFN